MGYSDLGADKLTQCGGYRRQVSASKFFSRNVVGHDAPHGPGAQPIAEHGGQAGCGWLWGQGDNYCQFRETPRNRD
jgi:hypothetical protein